MKTSNDFAKEIYMDICERIEKDGYISTGFIDTYTNEIEEYIKLYSEKNSILSNKHQILQISIEGEELVIRIGLDTLKYATENSPNLDFESDDRGNKFIVTDTHTWAESVIIALEKEEENGTTPIHKMFDEAFLYALDQGLEGIEEKETI